MFGVSESGIHIADTHAPRKGVPARVPANASTYKSLNLLLKQIANYHLECAFHSWQINSFTHYIANYFKKHIKIVLALIGSWIGIFPV